MARTKAQLSAGARLADYLAVGYLAMRCPIGKVRETLAQQGLESQRRRGLPHDVLIFCTGDGVLCQCRLRGGPPLGD